MQHHAIPSGIQLVGQGYVLIQDNDPIKLVNSTKLYQRYIKSKEEQHIIQLMFWPVQSMDLNSNELLWDELN